MNNYSQRVVDVQGVHVVSLAGELDLESTSGLAEWLTDISGSLVIVDLSEVTFMDSSGIAALAMARGEIERTGNELKIARPRPNVAQVLDIVGLRDWVVEWNHAWDSR